MALSCYVLQEIRIFLSFLLLRVLNLAAASGEALEEFARPAAPRRSGT